MEIVIYKWVSDHLCTKKNKYSDLYFNMFQVQVTFIKQLKIRNIYRNTLACEQIDQNKNSFIQVNRKSILNEYVKGLNRFNVCLEKVADQLLCTEGQIDKYIDRYIDGQIYVCTLDRLDYRVYFPCMYVAAVVHNALIVLEQAHSIYVYIYFYLSIYYLNIYLLLFIIWKKKVLTACRLSIHISVYIYLSIYLFISLSIFLSIYILELLD